MSAGVGLPRVNFGVLGPLEATNDAGPVNLRGSRHRAVLARLLIARGRVVPVSWLIDDLWDEAPPGALGAVQTFVGALRKALEPDRPPRTPSVLLVTAPPGYALRTAPETVDAWVFDVAVAESATMLAGGQALQALARLDEALGRWRGPAYAEFAEEPWAVAEATRLNELRALAVLRRAEARLALGQVAEAVPDLEAQVAAFPLREDGWRLLALALYQTGRPGDALATLRRAGEVTRTHLGLDPGRGLRQLEADILAQSPSLDRAPAPPPPTPSPMPAPSAMPTPSAIPAPPPFVGRTRELAELDSVAAVVAAARRPRLALVSGAAGAGKSELARILSTRLAAAGWITAWGTSPDVQGAPAAWPWTQLRASLPETEAEPEAEVEPEAEAEPESIEDAGEDPVVARFRRHRAIGAYLAALSKAAPVVLVFDDLHWADEQTLALVTALATSSDTGAVLIVGTYRSTEISAGLTQALGRAARAEPARIYLSGLTEPEVLELVRAITYRPDVTPAEAHVIHARSAGNPFFVRELTRLWEGEGDAGLRQVPAGVREVIRHRLGGLAEPARTHLRQASVIGPEVDLDVLIALAGDEDAVLASIESAVLAGFLVEQDADRLRFTHALVRETLYDDIAGSRRARWHTAVAEIIERARPDDVETIAYHFVRAASRTTAARAAHYARAAAIRAERRCAPHDAARLWRETIAALDTVDVVAPGPLDAVEAPGTLATVDTVDTLDTVDAAATSAGTDGTGDGAARTRLEAVMGMVRALAVTGELSQARRHRSEAIAAAEAIGDPRLAAEVIGSFDVPAIWTTNDDEALSDRVVAAAQRCLAALGSGHEAQRARLLISIAMERRADPGPAGKAAAAQAERIARGLGDPALVAFALNGRFMQTFHRAGLAPRRARIGEELLDLADRHGGMVTFAVLGHLILIQASAALADLAAADRHEAEADRLAERYDLPLVGVFTDFYRALRLVVTGRAGEAETAYRAIAHRLPDTGMSGLDKGILPLARLSLQTADTTSEADATTEAKGEASDVDWGPFESWGRPLVLWAQGQHDRARAATHAIPDSPYDLLFEARTCLHAIMAVHIGDQPTMRRLYAKLLPAQNELAGAGSGLVAFGPVAHHLGRLSGGLGRPGQAAEHYRQAAAVADRAQAPRWKAAALEALRRPDSRPSTVD